LGLKSLPHRIEPFTEQSRLELESCYTNTRIWLVDLCGTLVRGDTTIGFVRYHLGKQPGMRRTLCRAMTAQYSPLRLIFVLLERLSGRHLFKHWVVSLLAGTTLEKLENSAKEYAAFLLKERRLPEVWQLLSEKKRGDLVIIASASLEPVVRQIAQQMQVCHVASVLEECGGVLTGRYAIDITGEKEQAIKRKYQGVLVCPPMRVISDNLSDRLLLEMADEPYVILHRPSHRHRWAGMKAVFIDAS
jgi:phosphoserine phosphatase